MQVGVVWRKEGRVEGEQVSGIKYPEVSKFSADSRRFSQMRSYGLNMRPSPPRTTWPAEDDIAAAKAIRSPNIIRPRSGDDNVSPPRSPGADDPRCVWQLSEPIPVQWRTWCCTTCIHSRLKYRAIASKTLGPTAWELGSSSESVKHSRDNHTARQAIT